MFEYIEDENFFRKLLGNDFDEKLFDFRDPVVKRKEFNKKRTKLLEKLLHERGDKCQLRVIGQCSDKLEVDHLIPISSNVLNINTCATWNHHLKNMCQHKALALIIQIIY
jgi:hypothetical protein